MFSRPLAGPLSAGGLLLVVSFTAAAQTPTPPSAKPPALTVTGTPAQDTAKGASLMSEARKALGGEDKVAAIKRIELKGTITQVAGNQTLDGDLVLDLVDATHAAEPEAPHDPKPGRQDSPWRNGLWRFFVLGQGSLPLVVNPELCMTACDDTTTPVRARRLPA